MENWKPLLEKALAKEYPGTTIKWDGDDPALIIPDELKDKANEIVEYAIALWNSWGGESPSVETVICARCGEEYPAEYQECTSCGLSRIGRFKDDDEISGVPA